MSTSSVQTYTYTAELLRDQFGVNLPEMLCGHYWFGNHPHQITAVNIKVPSSVKTPSVDRIVKIWAEYFLADCECGEKMLQLQKCNSRDPWISDMLVQNPFPNIHALSFVSSNGMSLFKEFKQALRMAEDKAAIYHRELYQKGIEVSLDHHMISNEANL